MRDQLRTILRRGFSRAVGMSSFQLEELGSALDSLRVQSGSLEAREVARLPPDSLQNAEFSVFSQFGEDGLIQFLLAHVPIENEVFVEFGVEDYRESNTRFLLALRNWRGLIMDAGTTHNDFIANSGLAWRHHIDAVTAFIDRDNINDLLTRSDLVGDIGLMSIDLDGIDLWVLDVIETVSPRILIVEYNSLFGPTAEVTVPYAADFARGNAHWSTLYWGASISALSRVAGRKGYALVGSNSAGSNAFFVRRDVLGKIPEVYPAEAFRENRFRESRSPYGELTYLSDRRKRLIQIGHLPVVDVATDRVVSVADRFAAEIED